MPEGYTASTGEESNEILAKAKQLQKRRCRHSDAWHVAPWRGLGEGEMGNLEQFYAKKLLTNGVRSCCDIRIVKKRSDWV